MRGLSGARAATRAGVAAGRCGCRAPAGLALETQDNNLQACRFYQRIGFRLGGVNTMLYKNFRKPVRDETALFWYLLFS